MQTNIAIDINPLGKLTNRSSNFNLLGLLTSDDTIDINLGVYGLLDKADTKDFLTRLDQEITNYLQDESIELPKEGTIVLFDLIKTPKPNYPYLQIKLRYNLSDVNRLGFYWISFTLLTERDYQRANNLYKEHSYNED